MTIGLMNAIITERSRDARVVELADSLDSGSSAHSGRAGSSPASRTSIVVSFLLATIFFAPFQYLMLGHNKYIFRPGFRLKARPDLFTVSVFAPRLVTF